MQASEGKNRFFGNLWATKLKGARRMTPWRTAKIRCTTLGHLDRQFTVIGSTAGEAMCPKERSGCNSVIFSGGNSQNSYFHY